MFGWSVRRKSVPTAPSEVRRLRIRNTTAEPMTIYVEIYPDRYVLEPGSMLEIHSDLNGSPYHVEPFTGGMTIYPWRRRRPVCHYRRRVG